MKHPVTNKQLGYLTDLRGHREGAALGDKYVTAQIIETWDGVERGDLVGPYGERLTDAVATKPNAKAIKGYIVTAHAAVPHHHRRAHFLVMDKGSGDGVQVGNTFTIVRKGNPVRQEPEGWTAEDEKKLNVPAGRGHRHLPRHRGEGAHLQLPPHQLPARDRPRRSRGDACGCSSHREPLMSVPVPASRRDAVCRDWPLDRCQSGVYVSRPLPSVPSSI